MATLTITVPESDTITVADFLVAAARGWGWHPDQGITPEEAVLDALERDLHYRFRSGATHLSREEVEAELPIPESRGQRKAREREDARAEAERAAEAAGGGGAGNGGGGGPR